MQISSLLLAFVALAGVLGLVVLCGRIARLGGFAPRLASQGNGRVALVQAVALDSKRRVHLLRCDGRHVLLLTGGGQDVVIGWLDAEPGA